jgi:hypothetical protein
MFGGISSTRENACGEDSSRRAVAEGASDQIQGDFSFVEEELEIHI